MRRMNRELPRNPSRPSRSGMSIAEALTVVLLVSIVLVVVFGLWQSGRRQQDFVEAYADLGDKTRRGVRRLERDLRGALMLRELRRAGTRLSHVVLALPRGPDPLDGFEDIRYEYRIADRRMLRQGEALVLEGVQDVELFAFDDLGKALDDVEATTRLSFLRLRLRFGEEGDPPNRRRTLDLTIAPRVPASQARAERLLFERAFERFRDPPSADDREDPDSRF